MSIHGHEGKLYSEEERNDLIQNHSNSHGHEAGYRRSVTFGKKFLKQLLKGSDVKGLTFEFFDDPEDGRKSIFPVPVNSQGDALPIEDFIVISPRGGGGSDPIKCPPRCNP